MTILFEKKGSLFDSDAPVLAHGVNTAGLMGAGIAITFKRLYPEMYAAYKAFCRTGNFAVGTMWPYYNGTWGQPSKWVYNIASQDKPGKNAQLYWFESALHDSIDHANTYKLPRIAMPRIGCGIGGLNWNDVRDIIEWNAEQSAVDIEVWTL